MVRSRHAELTVLVLAGGSLEEKSLGPAPPLWHHPMLLPAGSSLAIHQISRFYQAGPLSTELLVLLDSEPPPMFPIRGLESRQLFRIPPQSNILGSLRLGLAAVSTPWVLVNPITTLPSRPADLVCQIQIGDRSLIRENWSALRSSPGGCWHFESKTRATYDLERAAPFTGILCAPTAVLVELTAGIEDADGGDLLLLAEQLYRQAGAIVVATAWHDLGHRATLAASRRSRFSSRAFNKLEYCPLRDVIVKRSLDRHRLQAERSYLESLPAPLRRHFPALLPGRPSEAEALVMEAIPFPTLAELHLHWQVGPNAWLSILERLELIQHDLATSAPSSVGSSSWLYSAKLLSRWQQFRLLEAASHQKASKVSSPWWTREICLNGCWLPPLASQVVDLAEALEAVENNSRLHRIHGDFCFNNILCEPLYYAIRLIDPRGEPAGISGLPIGYGDSRYDLAKFYHSLAGHYDAIVNDLFDLRWLDESHIELELYIPPDQPFLARAFREIMQPSELSDAELCLLTASLFFSMLPLHHEDHERTVALAARGMCLFCAATS